MLSHLILIHSSSVWSAFDTLRTLNFSTLTIRTNWISFNHEQRSMHYHVFICDTSVHLFIGSLHPILYTSFSLIRLFERLFKKKKKQKKKKEKNYTRLFSVILRSCDICNTQERIKQ